VYTRRCFHLRDLDQHATGRLAHRAGVRESQERDQRHAPSLDEGLALMETIA
jgi:hypothetical protein